MTASGCGYEPARRVWSDTFIEPIKAILGPLLLRQAPLQVDREQATDLMTFRAKGMTIAARMRTAGYLDRYRNEFTVRSHLESGTQTELSKLMDGYADWMFYGHAADRVSNRVGYWMLIDLDKWRANLLRVGMRQPWHTLAKRIDNRDGSHGLAFDVRDFTRPPIVLATAADQPDQPAPPARHPLNTNDSRPAQLPMWCDAPVR